MQASGKRMARFHHEIDGALMVQPASYQQIIRQPPMSLQSGAKILR
jgi:hypothetical protein